VKQRFRADGSQTSNLYKIETEFIGVFVTGKNMSNLDISPFTNEEGGVFTHEGGTPSPMKPLEVLPNSSINQKKVLNKNLSDFTSFEKITIDENEINKSIKVNPFTLITHIEKERIENFAPKEKKEKATEPKAERKPNPTYEAFTVFCQTFEELSGAAYPTDKNGHYIMSGKDAGGMVYLMRFIEQVDRLGNTTDALKVFLNAAWKLNDKWIKANFTPSILHSQSSKIFTGYQTTSPEAVEKKRYDRIQELLAERMAKFQD
jgi:hypothetical protein